MEEVSTPADDIAKHLQDDHPVTDQPPVTGVFNLNGYWLI